MRKRHQNTDKDTHIKGRKKPALSTLSEMIAKRETTKMTIFTNQDQTQKPMGATSTKEQAKVETRCFKSGIIEYIYEPAHITHNLIIFHILQTPTTWK